MVDKHHFKSDCVPFYFKITQIHVCRAFYIKLYWQHSAIREWWHTQFGKNQPHHCPSGWYKLENEGLLVVPEFSHTDSLVPSLRRNNSLQRCRNSWQSLNNNEMWTWTNINATSPTKKYVFFYMSNMLHKCCTTQLLCKEHLLFGGFLKFLNLILGFMSF